MFAYIIRRTLYAIPTLLGVNVIVFALFFFVNTPDNMARFHSGGKHVTREQIDEWKREHALDLPYFYNDGWRRVDAVAAKEKTNRLNIDLLPPGKYALVVEPAGNIKEKPHRSVAIKSSQPKRLILPKPLEDGVDLTGETDTRRFEFSVQGNQADESKQANADSKEEPSPAALTVLFNVDSPAPNDRIILEYQGELSLGSRLTQTIFYQRSLRMLWFQYGKSDDGKDIGNELYKRVLPSLSIAVPAFIFALILNVVFAMMAAFYRGTYLDYWGVFACVLLMSISSLYYIMGGQLLAGKYLRLVPISGYDFGLESFKFIILPILIILMSDFGSSVRFYRTIFLEEINRDYIRTARAKGLPESAVLFLHVLRNAMLPILTGVVATIPFLFTGDLLVESFFAIPGMGSYTLNALQTQDFAVTQAMVSLGAFIYVIVLMLTDISYTLADPRVRLD